MANVQQVGLYTYVMVPLWYALAAYQANLICPAMVCILARRRRAKISMMCRRSVPKNVKFGQLTMISAEPCQVVAVLDMASDWLTANLGAVSKVIDQLTKGCDFYCFIMV